MAFFLYIFPFGLTISWDISIFEALFILYSLWQQLIKMKQMTIFLPVSTKMNELFQLRGTLSIKHNVLVYFQYLLQK